MLMKEKGRDFSYGRANHALAVFGACNAARLSTRKNIPLADGNRGNRVKILHRNIYKNHLQSKMMLSLHIF